MRIVIVCLVVLAWAGRAWGEVQPLGEPDFAATPAGYSVVGGADSVEALREKAKPALVLPSGEFLWTAKPQTGERYCMVAHPYIQGGKAGPRQAVILDETTPHADQRYAARATAILDRALDANKANVGNGAYATVLSMDPVKGTLYQLGFPEVWEDHNTVIENRILVMHDPAHGWRFVTKFAVDGCTLPGHHWDRTTVVSRVRWTNDAANPLHLDLTFSKTATSSGTAPLTTSADFFCGLDFPLSTATRPYYVLQKGDTLSSLALRLVQIADVSGEKIDKRVGFMLKALLKLNSGLDPEKLVVGTRVTIPTAGEALEASAESLKALTPALPPTLMSVSDMGSVLYWPQDVDRLGNGSEVAYLNALCETSEQVGPDLVLLKGGGQCVFFDTRRQRIVRRISEGNAILCAVDTKAQTVAVSDTLASPGKMHFVSIYDGTPVAAPANGENLLVVPLGWWPFRVQIERGQVKITSADPKQGEMDIPLNGFAAPPNGFSGRLATLNDRVMVCSRAPAKPGDPGTLLLIDWHRKTAELKQTTLDPERFDFFSRGPIIAVTERQFHLDPKSVSPNQDTGWEDFTGHVYYYDADKGGELARIKFPWLDQSDGIIGTGPDELLILGEVALEDDRTMHCIYRVPVTNGKAGEPIPVGDVSNHESVWQAFVVGAESTSGKP